MAYGILYLVGTPIGNLEDITLRALNVFKEVDVVASEDTRETLKILNHFEIKKRTIAFNEYNKSRSSQQLIQMLLEGRSVALTCDRGMPGISDAGVFLVKKAIEKGINTVSIPGPTALITALVVSGLDTDSFIFEGFLPRKDSKLRKFFESVKNEQRTLVFYESPYRIKRTLKEMLEGLGDRNIAVCREMTKKFEEILRCKTSQAVEHFEENEPVGEFTIVVEGIK